jgi:glycerol-3-phosphate dehydrogenase
MSPSAADATADGLSLKIGFLGLGTMGASIVSALLQAGFSVTVWNRTPSKVHNFRAHSFIAITLSWFSNTSVSVKQLSQQVFSAAVILIPSLSFKRSMPYSMQVTNFCIVLLFCNVAVRKPLSADDY